MSAPTLLESVRETVYGLWPWARGIFVRSKDDGGALAIRSASGRIEMQCDPRQGLPVARKSDLVVRVWSDGIGGLYLSATESGPPYAWVMLPTPTIPGSPPTSLDAGTPIYISAGSEKVTCG